LDKTLVQGLILVENLLLVTESHEKRTTYSCYLCIDVITNYEYHALCYVPGTKFHGGGALRVLRDQTVIAENYQ